MNQYFIKLPDCHNVTGFVAGRVVGGKIQYYSNQTKAGDKA